MSHSEELYKRIIAGGAAGIRQMISDQVTEEFFLDYKRSNDNGAASKLDNRDRSTLSRVVSGFGNSEGGVVVWGVDCRDEKGVGDVPTKPVPIQNPKRFKTWLDQATSGVTIPAHSSVQHQDLSDDGGSAGFVVSLIPPGSHPPYQAVPELAYYMRSGSAFSRIPHAVLAGMFGRRPQPKITPRYMIAGISNSGDVVHFQFAIMLRNDGGSIARDTFLQIWVETEIGNDVVAAFEPLLHDRWEGQITFGARILLIAKEGQRVPPAADVTPLLIDIQIRPPFKGGFRFTGSCGADGCGSEQLEMVFTADDFAAAYDAMNTAREDDPDRFAAFRDSLAEVVNEKRWQQRRD